MRIIFRRFFFLRVVFRIVAFCSRYCVETKLQSPVVLFMAKRKVKVEYEDIPNHDSHVLNSQDAVTIKVEDEGSMQWIPKKSKNTNHSITVVKLEEQKLDELESAQIISVAPSFSQDEVESQLNAASGSPSKSPKVKKVRRHTPPENWKEMLEGIREMRNVRSAPVDVVGAESLSDNSQDPKVYRFGVLVSVMLSSQTKDEQTAAAFNRLADFGLTVEKMIATPAEDIVKLIHGVSFHNRKAQYIKKTALILKEKYDGDIPNTLEALCALPGVGPKMALIALDVAFGVVMGIPVDTHVHRISNRLGWAKGETPEQTRADIESWIPQEIWHEINVLLVGFGQTLCKAVNPKCSECKIRSICPVGKKLKC